MSDPSNLTNHFLIAMPQLADPNFFHTVTYICEHNKDGAMGIVINRPLDIELGEILGQMDLTTNNPTTSHQHIFLGGPVQQERGFVLHKPTGGWDSTMAITDEISITTSRDILSAIAQGQGPAEYLIALGYAGWGEGQLEREIVENAWLSGPASLPVLFDTPFEERWKAAAALLGVDLNLLSGDAGHA
jgi:putative transcriptional regulator